MNYRYFCEQEWASLLGNFKHYSFAECMVAIMQVAKVKEKDKLIRISDERMIEIIKQTIINEGE